MSRYRNQIAALALVALGLAQMAGQVFGFAPLAGIGLASSASPAPKVFSSVEGLETFSTSFALEYETEAGHQRFEFDRVLYGRLEGPYNRRNPYGAVLAYGPILSRHPETAPMFWSVARFALCEDGPLLREVGIDARSIQGPITIVLSPRPGTAADLATRFPVDCP